MSDRTSAEIREGLDHPVIDIDGHTAEYLPAMADLLRDEGVDLASPQMSRLLPGAFGPYQSWYELDDAERAAARVSRPPWWGAPARNTRDLATALLPALLYDRLDELGIDVSRRVPEHRARLPAPRGSRPAPRRLPRAQPSQRRDVRALRRPLVPVAAIPMHTPDEALDALEHAVGELGFKAVLLAGYVQRPAPVVAEQHPELERWALWLDMYGIDSAYDYDPVWARCRDLGVSIAFHSGSIGWGSRQSISNYMYNHIGHLAEGQHALCKSLFMGGVTRRFPELNFAFLEGGAAWAVSLFADLIGHWEKRNRTAMDAPRSRQHRLRALRRPARALRQRLARRDAAGAQACAGGPRDARRVGGPATSSSPDDIRELFVPRLLLRVRGRRPA